MAGRMVSALQNGRTIRDRGRSRRGSVHSGQLERWLGTEAVEHVSRTMKGWYGPPIALAGVPGAVYADGDGDFVGELRAGFEASARDRAFEVLVRMKRRMRRLSHALGRSTTFSAGFAGYDDLINEATANGKRYEFPYLKSGPTGVTGATSTLWFLGSQPAAGAAAAAAPGGTVPTSATTGAFPYTNPTSGDTMHYVRGENIVSVLTQSLMLYDRIFSVTKTMASTATEAVTGVPTRYQSSTGTADDFIGGNFLFIECRTALPATAHNWTVCLYNDQDSASSTLPSVTGNASNIINRLDMPANTWFCPLAAGDSGVKALTQMQASASIASGALDFTIGHPIAIVPCPVANLACVNDGLLTAFNLERIFDNACLAFLELCKSAATATTHTGQFTAVAG
jgi:hypothetical protein